jgi:GDP-L-fucose synthase
MVTNKPQRLFIAGHRGMVGSALMRRFQRDSRYELVLRTRQELDLTNQASTQNFFATERPEVVVIAAARVGGIEANRSQPVEFLVENLQIATNTITAAYEAGCQRLLFLSSSCVYPPSCPQPMREEHLLTAAPEQTNEAYTLAKIEGMKLCSYYRRQFGVMFHSVAPTNLYGPGDNYHPERSHVLPAMVRRFHEAKLQRLPEVKIWGSGTPRRELLFVEDLADAVAHLIEFPNPPDWVNVGTGEDLTILEIAQTVARVVGYEGQISTDPSRPDGPKRKLCDVSQLSATGWKARTDFVTGLKATYADFQAQLAAGALRSA